MSQVITASNTVRAHMPHMRAATRWLLVWMLCGTAPACGGDSSPRQFVTRDSAGVRIVESSAPAWANGDGWTVEANHLASIGVEEGEPKYILAYAWRPRRLSDGRIIVPNRRRACRGPSRHP